MSRIIPTNCLITLVLLVSDIISLTTSPTMMDTDSTPHSFFKHELIENKTSYTIKEFLSRPTEISTSEKVNIEEPDYNSVIKQARTVINSYFTKIDPNEIGSLIYTEEAARVHNTTIKSKDTSIIKSFTLYGVPFTFIVMGDNLQEALKNGDVKMVLLDTGSHKINLQFSPLSNSPSTFSPLSHEERSEILRDNPIGTVSCPAFIVDGYVCMEYNYGSSGFDVIVGKDKMRFIGNHFVFMTDTKTGKIEEQELFTFNGVDEFIVGYEIKTLYGSDVNILGLGINYHMGMRENDFCKISKFNTVGTP